MAITAGDILLDVAKVLFEMSNLSFSSGLFTEDELLHYIQEVQDDFLTKTRCVFDSAYITLNAENRYYDQPADVLRLERIGIGGYPVINTSQEQLDLLAPNWENEDTRPSPTGWFQDKVRVDAYGFRQIPSPFVTLVTAATNASPIVITTQDPHGRTTGQQVVITGATGNTAANGVQTVTVVSPTQLNLNGTTGNGAYNANSGVMGIPVEIWYSKKTSALPSRFSNLLVPFVFTPYIKYGVLARSFDKDGEQRNPPVAKLCKLKYDFGVLLAQRFMEWSKMDPRLSSRLASRDKFPMPAAVEVKASQ